MELSVIIPHIEALIFAAERPLTTLELCDLVNNALGFIEDRASLDQTEAAIAAIKEKYAAEFYPFEVRESGGGWQFLTKKEYHKTVAQINGDKFLKRLSTAALETLSIIAYKQPITKGEMEAIRGVNCDYAVQKLLEKELIVILGRNEKLPGHPLVYGTSRSFMDYFGINSPEDLPKIKEVISTDIIDPTAVQSDTLHVAGEEALELETGETLIVTEDGELLEQSVTEETSAEEVVIEVKETIEETVTDESAAEEEIVDVVAEEEMSGEAEEEETTEETEAAEEQAEEEGNDDDQSNEEETKA
ncbi:segregation and condensation protein B [Lacibacter cauensis]|uniref:Segregation and condensation protein B n=1 Tax=Lacibacter cauensis TaxID=510947 RepID=A0A562SII5_9BACT|nr:SMC-Scp complex subunit ScpB [Lacibacter cauensis]TWI81087.1 segregation and condensation protein B [Lacibacter cauensis]